MCSNLQMFQDKIALTTPIKVGLPDGTVKSVKYVGTVKLSPGIVLFNVLFLPDFTHNLLPIGKLCDDSSFTASFTSEHCILQASDSAKRILLGHKQAGLYVTSLSCSPSDSFNGEPVSVFHSHYEPDFSLLHARLGHPSISKMQHMSFPCPTTVMHDFHYESCLFGKFHKLPFSVSESHASSIFALVHVDL
ncbi:Retrovirus-related Pol polyprotein from transposon RE1 [Bienertia sinuspersici]